MTILAVASWGLRRFGPLDPARMMRVVIPTVLSLTLGFQVVLASFFLSVLGMKRSTRGTDHANLLQEEVGQQTTKPPEAVKHTDER